MIFSDLYHAVVEDLAQRPGSHKPVPFEFLRKFVTRDQSLVHQLDILRVTYSPPIRDARFTLFDEREGLHEDPVYYAQVTFCAGLDNDPTYLLYVLTKELMHVFDPEDTWINTREKFFQFLRDLQNTPLKLENGAINHEHKARWMATLVLCPDPIRQYIMESAAKGIKDRELARELGLPEFMVAVAQDPYYDTALALMLKGPESDPVPDPNLPGE